MSLEDEHGSLTLTISRHIDSAIVFPRITLSPLMVLRFGIMDRVDLVLEMTENNVERGFSRILNWSNTKWD